MSHIVTIVDDDASVRRALGRLLRSAGFAIAVFASAEEFLASGDPRTAACLVFDIQRNGISGWELLTRVRAAGVHTPVLLVTSHDDPRTRDQVAQSGATAYLRKPLDPATLLRTVRAVLAGPTDANGAVTDHPDGEATAASAEE
jgi:FixJ family two-component response regulator